MQLYLLETVGGVGFGGLQAVVVRAASEDEARKIAQKVDVVGGEKTNWSSPAVVKCQVVSTWGPAGVICADFVQG